MNEDKILKKEKQKIDILNEELYYKNKEFEQRKRRKIHGRKINLKHDFDEENYEKLLKKNKKRKLPSSLFKKIFFVVLFFFLISATLAVLSLYDKKESVSDELISMEILGQPFIDGGEDLELKIRIQNFNEQELELPDIILSYPKDSSSSEDDVFLRRSLSNIGVGQRVDEEFKLTLFGKEGDVRKLHASLEYRVKGSTSIFLKEIDHELIIRSTPTNVSIDGPNEAILGQEIQIDINFSSNSNKQINDMLLVVDYPLGFEFISSSLDPKFGNHTWYLQNISKEENTISITGKLSALPGQGQSFHVKMGKQNILKKNIIETVFNEVTHTVDIKEAFIVADLRVNGKNNNRVVIRGGGDASVDISFKNTLDRKLNNVQIVAHLIGDLYKPEKIRTVDGDYDSNRKTITWNKDNFADLEFIEPGESNNISFNIETKDLVSASNVFEKPNFGIILDVSGIDINGEVLEAFSVERIDVIANTDLVLIAKTLHSDGPFKNTGPIPPRVGKKTSYTITFQVTNSSNYVEQVNASTFLPPYVNWLGEISPSTEKDKITYNDVTREVKWEIGSLRAGIGIGSVYPKQVSFQVNILPSLSHVDTLPKLTRHIILSGVDSFTDTNLTYKKTPLNTRLSESSANSGDSRVTN